MQKISKIIILALVSLVGTSPVFAWTSPTQIPPGGNVESPINTSTASQFKRGSLAINKNGAPMVGSALDVYGIVSMLGALIDGSLTLTNGSLSLVRSPAPALTPSFIFADGTEGAGKVLISDISGRARWTATSTLGIVSNGADSVTTNRGIQTKQGGLILQSRLSDGSSAQYGLVVENAPIKSTGGLIIETRTQAQGNPVNPENGRMWLMTN